MPLQKNEDFGTNGDGSKNKEYCHFCFQNGNFTDAGITMEQKIEKLVRLSVSQLNLPEGQARKMANEIIPILKRWRKE
jgi:hypothetical protein